MIALRREETGLLVMELSEHLWPDDLELAIPVVHDVARSRRNPLLLRVVIGSDFDTPLWDFLSQILQPGILAENRPSRVAVLTKDPAEPTKTLDSGVEIRIFGSIKNARPERGFCHSRLLTAYRRPDNRLRPVGWGANSETKIHSVTAGALDAAHHPAY